jgi:hypothetical protein
MDDLNARLNRLREQVAGDGEAVKALRRRQREVATYSHRIREQMREAMDRMQRPTAG